MSNIQRAAIAARLAKLHKETPHSLIHHDHEEEEEDGLGDLPPRLPATSSSIHPRTSPSPYSPIAASQFFAQAVQVSVPLTNLEHRVYFTPPSTSNKIDPGSVIIFHHGAGYSALSFSLVAKAIGERCAGELGVLAFDARRHGGHSVPYRLTDGSE